VDERGTQLESKSWWGWPILAGFGLVAVTTTYRAFTVPWNWDQNQCLFVFFCVCLGYVLSVYLTLWMRGGTQAIKDRWATAMQMKDPRLSKQQYHKSPIFWGAIVLTVAITLLSDPEARQFLFGLLH
jgi:hypothetical protein